LNASPYSEEVYDTMTRWAGFRNTVSLAKLVDALGLQGKGEEIDEEIDGSQVWFFVEQGKIEEVANYCIGDVIRVQQAYRKMNFLD
jgi:predicted PolB exonuclease-like 3'-5' exonuclease